MHLWTIPFMNSNCMMHYYYDLDTKVRQVEAPLLFQPKKFCAVKRSCRILTSNIDDDDNDDDDDDDDINGQKTKWQTKTLACYY